MKVRQKLERNYWLLPCLFFGNQSRWLYLESIAFHVFLFGIVWDSIGWLQRGSVRSFAVSVLIKIIPSVNVLIRTHQSIIYASKRRQRSEAVWIYMLQINVLSFHVLSFPSSAVSSCFSTFLSSASSSFYLHLSHSCFCLLASICSCIIIYCLFQSPLIYIFLSSSRFLPLPSLYYLSFTIPITWWCSHKTLQVFSWDQKEGWLGK